jgi:hypothetical protein
MADRHMFFCRTYGCEMSREACSLRLEAIRLQGAKAFRKKNARQRIVGYHGTVACQNCEEGRKNSEEFPPTRKIKLLKTKEEYFGGHAPEAKAADAIAAHRRQSADDHTSGKLKTRRRF